MKFNIKVIISKDAVLFREAIFASFLPSGIGRCLLSHIDAFA
jgi:hypothetical protein